MRKKLRKSQSMMAVLGFFILSSSIVLGGGGSLLLMPGMPEGALPTEDSIADITANEVAPTIAPPESNVQLARPEPVAKPAWSVIGSSSIPVAPVSASAGLVVDDKSGEIIAAKNVDETLPMASITKLMTAWVALDKAAMDKEIKVSHKAAATPPTHMPLGEGEVLTVGELLHMVLLTSANDAAQALADGLGGEAAFVSAMNDKARELGLEQTTFANPTGFDAPGHQSSARDLANMAHHLFVEYPELLPMLQKSEVSVPANNKHRAFYVANFHPLVGDYAGFLGGKPGFTGNAGNCLLTVAERKGERIIAVVLNSPDSASESKRLLDFGFEQLR